MSVRFFRPASICSCSIEVPARDPQLSRSAHAEDARFTITFWSTLTGVKHLKRFGESLFHEWDVSRSIRAPWRIIFENFAPRLCVAPAGISIHGIGSHSETVKSQVARAARPCCSSENTGESRESPVPRGNTFVIMLSLYI